MAKAPEFQPIINQPNFKAYVAEPIVSKTGGADFEIMTGMAKEAGKTIVEDYQQSEIKGLQKQTAQHIQDYLATSPTAIKQAQIEAAGLENTMSQFTQVPMEEGVSGEMISAAYSGVQAELDKKLEFLRKAKDQGMVTGADFTERVLKSTREAVAKNPGITRELLSSAHQTMSLYGIQDRIQRDESLLKSQQDAAEAEYKAIQQEAKERNITTVYDNGEPVPQDIVVQQIMGKRRDAAADQALKEMHDNKQYLDEIEVNELVRKGAPFHITNRHFDVVSSQITTLFNQEDGLTFDKKLVTAKKLALDSKASVRERLAPYMANQTVKDAVAFHDSRIDAFVTAMDNFKSGEDYKKYLANNVSIVESIEKQDLHSRVNVTQQTFLADLSAKYALFLGNSPEEEAARNANIKSYIDITTYGNLNPITLERDARTGRSMVGNFVEQHLDDISKGKTDGVGDFNKTMSAYFKNLTDPAQTPNMQSYFDKADQIISVIKSPNYTKAFEKLDADNRGKLVEMVGTYNDQLALSVAQYTKLHPNENINLQILEDGTLVATGASSEFQRNYVARINSGLEAYANSRGSTKQKVYQEFYKDHYRKVFAGEEQAAPAKPGEKSSGIDKDYINEKYNQFSALDKNVDSINELVDKLTPANLGVATKKDVVTELTKALGKSGTAYIDFKDPVNMSKAMSILAAYDNKEMPYEDIFNNLPNKKSKVITNPAKEAGIHWDQIRPEVQREYRKNLEADARALKNNPEAWASLSKAEQDQVMTIIDPPLETSSPELWVVGGLKGFGAIFRKLETKGISHLPPKVDYQASKIKDLMVRQGVKDKFSSKAEEIAMRKSTAKAAEKAAAARARGE